MNPKFDIKFFTTVSCVLSTEHPYMQHTDSKPERFRKDQGLVTILKISSRNAYDIIVKNLVLRRLSNPRKAD